MTDDGKVSAPPARAVAVCDPGTVMPVADPASSAAETTSLPAAPSLSPTLPFLPLPVFPRCRSRRCPSTSSPSSPSTPPCTCATTSSTPRRWRVRLFSASGACGVAHLSPESSPAEKLFRASNLLPINLNPNHLAARSSPSLPPARRPAPRRGPLRLHHHGRHGHPVRRGAGEFCDTRSDTMRCSLHARAAREPWRPCVNRTILPPLGNLTA